MGAVASAEQRNEQCGTPEGNVAQTHKRSIAEARKGVRKTAWCVRRAFMVHLATPYSRRGRGQWPAGSRRYSHRASPI